NAVQQAYACKGQPSCLILNTVKGKGATFAEPSGAHSSQPTQEQWDEAIAAAEAALEAVKNEKEGRESNMSVNLIGKHEKDSRANRDGYVEAMLEMMAENDKLVHIDCDLMGCINTGKLQKAFPERTFNAGIAEQNAMGVAAGMAATGLTAFVHSFGC